MIGEHSILASSASGIWGKPNGCTGYVSMAQQCPELGDDQDAKEGSATHDIGSELIDYAARGVNSTTAEEYIGEEASTGVIYNEERIDAAKIYADDVANIMRSVAVFGGPNFGNEERVECPSIHPRAFGTTDQFIYHDRSDGGDLYLWDFKYGHEFVEVFENWQLTNYTSGIIEDRANIRNWIPSKVKVHFRIVQPRAFHKDGPIREWVTTLDVILKNIDILRVNAAISLSDKATLRTGSHCKHCQARIACPPALEAGLGMFECTGKPVPVDLSPQALGVQYALIERCYEQIKSLRTGFNEQVKSLARKGVNTPGWLIEQGYGNEKWAKPVSEVIALGNIFKIDLKKPDEAITPVQARNKGIDDAVIKEYSTKPKTSIKVVRDDGTKLKLIFGDK